MSAQPRSRTADNRFYGTFEGIVTRTDDPEGEGRVKVTYPWFNKKMESEWAPVMQFFAGPGHGSFFVPVEGSLVLCSCRHGDLRKPVIVGGLYNGEDKPNSDHVRRREIASENGHRLAMYDSKGDSKGAIVLEDSSGCKITLSSTGHVVIKACGALTFDAPIIRFKGKGYNRVLTPKNDPV